MDIRWRQYQQMPEMVKVLITRLRSLKTKVNFITWEHVSERWQSAIRWLLLLQELHDCGIAASLWLYRNYFETFCNKSSILLNHIPLSMCSSHMTEFRWQKPKEEWECSQWHFPHSRILSLKNSLLWEKETSHKKCWN